MWSMMFFINSILLGVGLAMDAFSVSLANGLHEPCMSTTKMCKVAGVFGFFQALMPMIGWLCVHTIIRYFTVFHRFVPWIALFLLGYIGGSMLWEGLHGEEEEQCQGVGKKALLMQGIATSIDALSVGFTIADYDLSMALCASLIIAAVTFIICMEGLRIGKRMGTRLSGKASILGGLILLLIGLEIFFKGIV